ncbi:hypothetical protein AMK59_8636 [Oryctes borbonicus]|uniref:GOLD domain-containing protein n=1 Tax=Oryctes borbonicus TaxID=1629725 RepID=A0A0T6ATT4_9SCAR|nr:hypothetical protein AMK59_8636 [Oryctes borbonicus]
MDKCTLFTLCFFTFIIGIKTHEKQLTVNIEPRKQDCFFENISEKQTVELDYQVIDGGHGDLDITFQTYDPHGRILLADYKKAGNTHTLTTQLTGDYKFCFDNTFSSFNTKTVFFEIIIESDDDFGGGNIDGINSEEVYELKIQDIQDIVNRVRSDMNKIRVLQDVIKSIEARDRNLAEENFFKVTTFSMIQIIVMIVVGSIQVIMLRSLFDDNSRVHKIWKNLESYR